MNDMTASALAGAFLAQRRHGSKEEGGGKKYQHLSEWIWGIRASPDRVSPITGPTNLGDDTGLGESTISKRMGIICQQVRSLEIGTTVAHISAHI